MESFKQYLEAIEHSDLDLEHYAKHYPALHKQVMEKAYDTHVQTLRNMGHSDAEITRMAAQDPKGTHEKVRTIAIHHFLRIFKPNTVQSNEV